MRSILLLAVCAACSSSPKIYGPAYDGGDGGDGATDSSSDVAPSDAKSDVTGNDASDAPSCASNIAVVGGNGSSLFGAGGPGGSALVAASLPGSALDCGNDLGCANPIAVARNGSSLLAVIAQTGGALASTTYQTSWADPAPVATAKSIDGPSLAVIGQTAHLLFQGVDYKYLHAEYTQSAWDGASDPVGGTGPSQSYGARGPGVGATGTDLVMVQAGSDSYLYDQTWTGTWAAAHKQGGAAVQNTLPPTMIALSGGASELLAAYLRVGDYKVMAVDRKAGTWNPTPVLLNTNAFSNDPVALAPLPNGKALLVFRGSDKKPYFSTWDGASTWTAPAPVVTNANPVVLSVPSVTTGVCGADAIAAYAESGGGVSVIAFGNGAFGAPQVVSGTTGAKFVAVGTLP